MSSPGTARRSGWLESLVSARHVGCWIGLLCGLVPCVLTAVEAPVNPPTGNGQVQKVERPDPLNAIPATKESSKPSLTPAQKRKLILVSSLLLAGILAVLLILLLWITWWSRRTHKMLRSPLPSATRPDELWYLKAKTTTGHDPEHPTGPATPPPPEA